MDIRPSPIAGTWYPGDAASLTTSIDQYLRDAEPGVVQGEIIGLVVPHAGHRYSGGIAAQAFRLIQGRTPAVVVILSPLHGYAAQAVLTCGHEAYGTPLGAVPIDRELQSRLESALAQHPAIELGWLRDDAEHSLEIELPFLQRSLPEPFALLPVMLREQSTAVARSVGAALGSLLQGRESLIIASTDLSHFHKQEAALKLDRSVLEHLARFDPEGLIRAEEEGRGFACGRGAVAAALWASQSLGANQVHVLKHATSGDVTGDYNSVVGYASAVICRAA